MKIGGAILAVIILMMAILTLGWINVRPTDVAVETNKVIGKVYPAPKGVGYHFFNRWVSDMVVYKVAARAFPPDTMASEDAKKYYLDLKTNDGQNINVDLTIIYALESNEVPALHQQVGRNYEDQVLLPQIRSESRIVVGSYSAEEIYQGKVRDAIQQSIKTKLASALSKYPAIQIQDALIRHFSFSPQFEKAIEEKKLAAQQVEINKNKAFAQEEEAKRQEAEARGGKLKAVQEATGRAESVRVEADAQRYKLEQEAAGNLTKYKAEAEGKRLMTSAMGGGQYVVGMAFAEKLAPGISTVTVPMSEKGNYIMDVSGIIKEALGRQSQSQ